VTLKLAVSMSQPPVQYGANLFWLDTAKNWQMFQNCANVFPFWYCYECCVCSSWFIMVFGVVAGD